MAATSSCARLGACLGASLLVLTLASFTTAPEYTTPTLGALLSVAPLSPARIEAAGVTRQSVNVTEVVIKLLAAKSFGKHAVKGAKGFADSGSSTARCEHASFNAAVQRRMRTARDPMFPVLVDKGHLRAVAAALGETTPRMLGLSDGCAQLPNASALPRDYVLKARHTTGCTLVVAKGRVVAHRTCNGGGAWLEEKLLGARFVGRVASDALLAEACRSFTRELYVFALSEWAYSQLSPGVVVEELMHGPAPVPLLAPGPHRAAATAATHASSAASATAGAPGARLAVKAPPPPLAEDLKCFVFRGTTRAVLHVGGRLEGRKTDSVFDAASGELLDVTVKGSRREQDPTQTVFALRPGLLHELRRHCDGVATALGLEFVRVDFLLTSSEGGGDGYRLLLGELTLYPGGGAFVWEPADFDEYLGSFLGDSSCEHTPYRFVWQRFGRR